MNLQERGMRFVLRTHPSTKDFPGVVESIWVDKLEPGDVDCTDMTDDELYQATINTIIAP